MLVIERGCLRVVFFFDIYDCLVIGAPVNSDFNRSDSELNEVKSEMAGEALR